MSKLRKRLIKAAKSAQAIAGGDADPTTYKVHVPAKVGVRAIRTRLKIARTHSPPALASCHPNYAMGNRTGEDFIDAISGD
jgi:hypothetical protein